MTRVLKYRTNVLRANRFELDWASAMASIKPSNNSIYLKS